MAGWTCGHRQGLRPATLAMRVRPEKLEERLRLVLEFSIVADDSRESLVALVEVSLCDVASHDGLALEHWTCQQYK